MQAAVEAFMKEIKMILKSKCSKTIELLPFWLKNSNSIWET